MTAHAAARERPQLGSRQAAIWSSVLFASGSAVGLATHTLVNSPPPAHRVVGILVLLALCWLAHRVTVPVADGGEMSFAGVFVVSAAVLYGAAAAALLAAIVEFVEAMRIGEHPLKLVFNTGVFALMGGAAGLAASVHSLTGLGLMAAVMLAAAAEYVVNVGLIAAIVVHGRTREFAMEAWKITKFVALPFALSTSIVPLYVVTWHADSYVALVTIIPLGALALHMRTLDETREARALALTDPLTGLGNRRSLTERLRRELDRADERRGPISVCVLDLDDFKTINDTHGHEAGDEALVAVAAVLRGGGEAFRPGGDEFVLLLPGLDADAAAGVAAAVSRRVNALGLSISVGVETYAGDSLGRADLLRRADEQLYVARAARR